MWACEQVAPCFTLRDKKGGGGTPCSRAPRSSWEPRGAPEMPRDTSNRSPLHPAR